MKVLICSAHYQPAWDWGGPVRSMWALARALVSEGVEVTVVTTSARQLGRVDVPRERVQDGVRIWSWPVLGGGRWRFANRHGLSGGFLAQAARLARWADVVHLDGFWGPGPVVGAIASRIAGKPYVISTRGTLEERSLRAKAWKKQIALALGVRRLIQGAGALHYTTEMERSLSPAWARSIPSFVVPNPVELSPLADGAGMRARFGAGEDTVLLGMFGRLHPRKGFDIILPAVAEAIGAADLKLVIVGPDEAGHAAAVLREVRRYGLSDRVALVGELSGPELAQAYAAIDLLVVPSYGESFGNVIVEAAGQGTPCVVSEEVGLKSWVADAGVGSVLPLDPHVWATRLARVHRKPDPRSSGGTSVRHLAEETFSPRSVARAIARQYAMLVARRSSGSVASDYA